MDAQGPLISFGDALKAFRRNVYTFPDRWRALVVCASHKQAEYAMHEARAVLNASSLPVQTYAPVSMKLTTSRGGEIKFVVVRELEDANRLAGEWPHIIVVSPALPDDARAVLRSRLRHVDIEDRYFRMDDATL